MGTNLLSQKIRFVYIGMLLFAIILSIFALRWQIFDAHKFLVYAKHRGQEETIPALRGTIYAADGSTLSYSEPRCNIFVYYRDLDFAERKKLQTREEFVSKMAKIFGVTDEELAKLLNESFTKGYNWFKIAENLSIDKCQEIKGLTRDKDKDLAAEKRGKIIGFTVLPTSRRVYPEGKLAAQILGLTQVVEDDNKYKILGLGGLEGEWDKVLNPRDGFLQGERDGLGNAVGIAAEQTIEAKRGSSIYTSIDKRLQKEAEEVIAWGVKTYLARSGSIVIMDPRTGRVMAMANYPTYDPNTREQTNRDAYGNRAISEPYEIGSVGKVFTLSAAIDSGKVKPQDVILSQGHQGCEMVVENTGEKTKICTADKLPVGPIPIRDAFRKSDNIYFIHLAESIERETYYNYLKKFGIGNSSGIDLAGESINLLTDWQKWIRADVAAYSYGHSYQANLLQVASAYGALANYGVRMQPQVVTKIVEADGSEKVYQPVAVEKVVAKGTVRQMDVMMHENYRAYVMQSSWEYFDLANYNIGMKSGTALIPDKNGKYSGKYNATYGGYDISSPRRFVMVVRVDSPRVGSLSNENAKFVWLKAFQQVKDIIGVKRIG
jgi:cell division protein FtsI (penicillin-binding protein 3)